jgi:small subunit ribosomal protein S7
MARWIRVAKKDERRRAEVFKKAVENAKPTLEVKTRRVGGANYQVPEEVNPFRRQSLAIRWILAVFARTRRQNHGDRLAE